MIPQQNIPGLQRVPSRQCVACGAPADAFCARCGLVPYCGQQCQRTDWVNRHRSVCHNLARFNEELEVREKEKNTLPPPKPLRQPHTPNANRESRRDDEPISETKKPYNTGSKANQQNHSPRNFKPNRRPAKPDREEQNQNNESFDDPKPAVESKSVQNWFNKNKKFLPTNSEGANGDMSKPGPSGINMSQGKPNSFKPDLAKPHMNETSGSNKTISKPSEIVSPPAARVDVNKSLPESNKSVPVVAKSEVKVMPLKSVTDATPVRKVIPKMYFVETLSVGDLLMLSVEAAAKDCHSKRPGFVCLSLHEKGEGDYQKLCEDYTVDSDAVSETYTPNPGDTFSYQNPEDGAYYRARCLNPTTAALLDSGKLATFKPEHCKRLLEKYEAIPEFCCQLDTGNIKIGDNLKCTLVAKIDDSYKVSLENVETGACVGDGQLFRWSPVVEYPVNTPVVIPEVPRPNFTNNAKVILVEASSLDRVFLRPADTDSIMKYDSVLHDVLLYGLKATPLTEPPRMGDYVVGKFTDGNHYRALCKRTSVKQNKYLLEYVEYGNLEKTSLQDIYPCPPEMTPMKQPTVVSMGTIKIDISGLTASATEYLEKLRDDCIELILTTPDGNTAPSGSEVILTVAKNKECVNKKLLEMCMPEWKKEQQTGKPAVSEPIMFSELTYLELPENGGQLCVLDFEMLVSGSLSVCPAEHPHMNYILNTLTEQMEEYCNSEMGSEPYLPKHEEMCIAKFPPFPQWFRAVLCQHSAGSGAARVLYVDFGNLAEVPVHMIRRIPRDFLTGIPALATLLEIEDFPQKPTPEMLTRAIEYMKIDDDNRGVLTVTRCVKEEPGQYKATAPGLLKAMSG